MPYMGMEVKGEAAKDLSLRRKERRGVEFGYFGLYGSANCTVMVNSTGIGLPLTTVGKNSHCVTASRAA